MPPATRREVRLSASLPGPVAQNGTTYTLSSTRSATMLLPNIDSILDNFEQFKRKHISQNRDIIKSNAQYAQRQRELEHRIQTLEQEKVDKDIQTLALTLEVEQLRNAISSVHASWMAIGSTLAHTTGLAPDSFDLLKPHKSPPLPESKRIIVDHPLPPSNLIKSVAQAPYGQLHSLSEESFHSDDRSHCPMILDDKHAAFLSTAAVDPHLNACHSHFEAIPAAQPLPQDMGFRESTDSAASLLDMAQPPSPMGSPKLPLLLEDATVAVTSQPWSVSDAQDWPHVSASSNQHHASSSSEYYTAQIPDRQMLRRSGRKSSRRQSGLIPPPGFDQNHSSEADSTDSTPAPSSDPYLPSETNSETMDGVMVYRGSDDPSHHSLPRHSTRALSDITNDLFSSSSQDQTGLGLHLYDHANLADTTPRKSRSVLTESHLDQHGLSLSSRRSGARSPSLRKRKSANGESEDPMPTPARLFTAAIDATPSDFAAEADLEPQTGRTRRTRKSVNYALPKLNTKMRKPDPSDLIPAATPHRSNSNTPASARDMIGSTGNLSDIRKLHEAAAVRQSPAQRASDRRSKDEAAAGEQDSGVLTAGLFQLRHSAEQQGTGCNVTSSTAGSLSCMEAGSGTSDDEPRVTSSADLRELAELEVALGQLCTSDEERRQVDTPIVPHSSIWPSYSPADMRASPSTDSLASRTSSTLSNGNTAKDSTLRRKTASLSSASRPASAEQIGTSNEQVDGRLGPSGLAVGMKPKQRLASAGATTLTARPAKGHSRSDSSGDRPRSYSGTTAVKAGLMRSAASNGALSRAARSTSLTSSQRGSLHSALAEQQKAKPARQHASVHTAIKPAAAS